MKCFNFAKTTHSWFSSLLGNPGGFFNNIMSKIKKKKVAIYIDGGNLYYKLKDKELRIKNTINFDYFGFCKSLARGREITSARYYVGVVKVKDNKDKKGTMLRNNQRKLFNNLKRNITIKRGHLMQNNGRYHEKGVDVQIAVDLLVGAYENYYDEAILVSSDTDLVPAIGKVKSLGRKVEYIGFAHQPSYGVMKNANTTRLLIKEDVEKFEKKIL